MIMQSMEDIQFYIEVSSALLTPVVAIAAVTIALQQWRINKMRHRHEMFDRRFEIYKSVQRCLSFILAHGNIIKSSGARNGDDNGEDFDLVGLLADAGQKAHFLMGKEMADYIFEVRKHAIHLRTANFSGNSAENAEKSADELNWLTDQLPILIDKFDPYLSLKSP